MRNEVWSIFNSRIMPEYLNKTLITLIPKSKNLESFYNYQPISLCNIVYKMVTKIIVACIRPFLSKRVSPFQSTFVPGRKGLDNAIIVQEIIHTMAKKKGRGGVMAIKLDLEKAYDLLEWSFIRDTLKLFRLPSKLISLILSCISSSAISILFTGGTLEAFHPSRGIHQGDPLSPYLFILCMEVLGALIEDKCKEKLWNPVKSSQSGPAFSHLFFTDDLMLFAKADRKNCIAIRDVLDSFCSLSGQKISDEKSQFFFSPNVEQTTREELSEVLGFRSTPFLGKYLGFPIKHKGQPQDFGFIIDRIQSKLAGWKANLLSFAGRVVLTNLVTSTIPNYTMQCVALPPKILKGVNRLNRNFIWGSSNSKRKLHLIGWNKIMKDKEEGGLGIQVAKLKNSTMLAKLNWRFKTEKASLWVRVLSHKYRGQRSRSTSLLNVTSCSPIWAGIKKGEDTVSKGV